MQARIQQAAVHENAKRPSKWPKQVFRRLLIDTHIPDWDPVFLSRLDPVAHVDLIARAGFQSLMVYANSCVGLCLWRTQVGQMHACLKDRDLFGQIIHECRRRDLHTLAYFVVVWDNWAFEKHPAWRVVLAEGDDRILQSRVGLACPNTPYREYTFACLREIVGNYPIDGIFIDMTFWTGVCYCPYCTARYWEEYKTEPPRIINWDDPNWRNFQKARQRWMLEFAQAVTDTVKKTRPISVYHQFSLVFTNWTTGQPLEITKASDFTGGDFYGGPTQYSMVCKAYAGLTQNYPFEVMTSVTDDLHDHVTLKPMEKLRVEALVATIHSAAQLMIDGINPDGTLNPDLFDLLGKLNRERAPYEPFLGGELQADVAIYYDKESMYDPAQNGTHVFKAVGWDTKCPHGFAMMGAGKILREAHIPFGLVTNANLSQLKNYRAVILPNVLEMTAEQAAQFRQFVNEGGVLYASGPSSLDRFDKQGPRYLLEDVLGVRYQGKLGSKIAYVALQDGDLKKVILPQDLLIFGPPYANMYETASATLSDGPWIQAEAAAGAEVLARVTLPFVAPELGHVIGNHFASFHSNPPALAPTTNPAIVVNSFGKGKAIWVAAPIESSDHPVNAKLIVSMLRRVLPGPYKFEADTNPCVEMTLYHQPENKRLLVGLLNMEEEIPPIPVPARVLVQVPLGRAATAVVRLPDRKPMHFERLGPYVQFQLEPFESMAMVLVEYQ